MRLLHYFLILLLLSPVLRGQESNVETSYLKLQEAYTQRLQDIESRHQKAERELLNQFILSLPRMEMELRDSGDLDGVMACRSLQEFLLTEMRFPPADMALPEFLKNQVDSLLSNRQSLLTKNQADLDQLNLRLLEALEPYQVEFTKANELERAMEIREIRMRLQEVLGDQDLPSSVQTPEPVRVSSNPNSIPFSYEPPAWKGVAGVTEREPSVAYDIQSEGKVDALDSGLRMQDGKFTIKEQATTILLERVKRNPMLTVEFGVRARAARQWGAHAPAVIFLYGNNLAEANLAITHEDQGYFLYLRTTMPPAKRTLYRIWIHRSTDVHPQHFTITYRSGELTVYVDGSETRKIRGDITGLLTNWEAYPIQMGLHPAPAGIPGLPEQINWRGILYQVNITTSLESSRGASENFNRFSRALTR